MIYAINLLLLGRAFLFGCAGFWSSGFRGRLGRWGFLGSGRATRVDQVKSVFSVEWELTNRRLSCGAESYVNAAVLGKSQNFGVLAELRLLRRGDVLVLVNGLLDLLRTHGLFFTQALGFNGVG